VFERPFRALARNGTSMRTLGRFSTGNQLLQALSPSDFELLAPHLTPDPQDIEAMSTALNDVCRALNVHDDARAKGVVAMRIIELVRRGERSASQLRDQLLAEANGTAL
jgi:hypothetical protein